MRSTLKSNGFLFDYKANPVEDNVLWESHCHGQFELIGVLEGDITVMFEGKPYRLSEHRYTVIPPLCYHTVTANKKGNYRRVTVLFDAEALPEALRPRFAEQREGITIGYSNQLSQLKEICGKADADFYAPLAQSILLQLLYQSLRENSTPGTPPMDGPLPRMLAYIDSHLCEKIRLDDIAAHAACSKSSVCHLFEEQMKISPKQYILQKRLALAETLLREGVPATETALRVGYENYSNFYRMYRKQFGTVPSEKKITAKKE